MDAFEEKLNIINNSMISKRMKRELNEMKQLHIFNNEHDIHISKLNEGNYTDYCIIIQNNLDKKTYKFILPQNYPFSPPKVFVNNKSYLQYLKLNSDHFRQLLLNHKSIYCFCCKTILCSNNWVPRLKLKMIFDELHYFHSVCLEIAHAVIIDVIKRKYLIDDINILEWLY